MKNRFVLLLLTLFGACSAASPCIEPIIVGHRGTTTRRPENTLAAFRYALAEGADGIELDIRLSKDQHLVVMHDNSLKRTTNLSADRSVNELTLPELKNLDAGRWFSSDFEGETIPSLADVIESLPADTLLMLDIKELAVIDVLKEFIDEHEDEYALKKRLIVVSTKKKALRQFHDYFPDVETGWFISNMDELGEAGDLHVKYVRVPSSERTDYDNHDDIREAGFTPLVGNYYLTWDGVVTISNTASWAAYRKRHRKPEECK